MIVDAAIVAFIGLFTWRGWQRGLLVSLMGLAGFVAATFAAVFGYRGVSVPIRAPFGLSDGTSYIVAALMIFLGVVVCFFIGGRMLTKVVRLTKWRMVNSAGGAALAGIWALSLVTVILFALSVVPVPRSVDDNVRRSTLGHAITSSAPGATRAVSHIDLRKVFAAFFPHESKLAAFR